MKGETTEKESEKISTHIFIPRRFAYLLKVCSHLAFIALPIVLKGRNFDVFRRRKTKGDQAGVWLRRFENSILPANSNQITLCDIIYARR